MGSVLIGPFALVVIWACGTGSDGPLDPETPRVAAAKGGIPGPPDGGGDGGDGGGSATVELAGGLVTTAPQTAEAGENAQTFALTTSGEETFLDAFNLTATYAAGLANCAQGGVFDEGLSPSDMLDLMVDPERLRDFDLRIDKEAVATGAPSDYHQIRRDWSGGIPSGRLVTWIGSESNKTSILGGTDPVVTSTALGGGTIVYTFHAGDGVVVFSQLSGKPPEHPLLVCHLLDDVNVTVTIG